jgi:hypothetical protein
VPRRSKLVSKWKVGTIRVPEKKPVPESPPIAGRVGKPKPPTESAGNVPARLSGCASKGQSVRGSSPRRSIGTIRPYVGIKLRSHRDCDLCEGRRVMGGWIHDDKCPNRSVIWFGHGYDPGDWTCWYGCPGQILASSVTHSWNCGFWNRTEATPF